MNNFMRLDDFNVPGYGLSVTGSLDIRTADLSGETSGTDAVSKGTKGKKLDVSLSIRFEDEADLRDLIRVAEARGNGGRLKVYTVANTTANAAGVRQARFEGAVRWQEKDGLRAWDVSFALREYLSNPERVEQREAALPVVKAVSDAVEVAKETVEAMAKDAAPEGTAAQEGEALTGFEKLLSIVDRMLR